MDLVGQAERLVNEEEYFFATVTRQGRECHEKLDPNLTDLLLSIGF